MLLGIYFPLFWERTGYTTIGESTFEIPVVRKDALLENCGVAKRTVFSTRSNHWTSLLRLKSQFPMHARSGLFSSTALCSLWKFGFGCGFLFFFWFFSGDHGRSQGDVSAFRCWCSEFPAVLSVVVWKCGCIARVSCFSVLKWGQITLGKTTVRCRSMSACVFACMAAVAVEALRTDSVSIDK